MYAETSYHTARTCIQYISPRRILASPTHHICGPRIQKERSADPAAVTTDSAAGGIVGILFSLLPLLLVFVLMYFMMIRPEKKRRKKEQDMLASLKKGDRVCTIGGIYATIESIKDDTITLSVGKGDQTMVVARWAIRSVEDVTIENETESLN